MAMAYIQARYKKKRLYVYFRFRNKAYLRPLPYYCTKDGKKGCTCKQCTAAEGLALEISRKIDSNTFVMADYFRDEEPVLAPAIDLTFPMYARQWLDAKTGLIRKTSISKYEQTVNKISPMLGMKLSEVKRSHIKQVVSRLVTEDLAPKTINEHISTLGSIFKEAQLDRLITENPCMGVQRPKKAKSKIDPFTKDEMFLILEWISKNYPKKVLFYALGFFTGMRPGEIVGLKWESIDFREKTINICRQHTGREEYEATKTNKDRIVEIIPQLMPYILKHKEYTFLQGGYVFLNQYKRPYISYDDFSRYYWAPCFRHTGIRRRKIYNMRHTFAVVMLNNLRMPLNWVGKKMLGHSDSSITLRIYADFWDETIRPDDSIFDLLNPEKNNQPQSICNLNEKKG